MRQTQRNPYDGAERGWAKIFRDGSHGPTGQFVNWPLGPAAIAVEPNDRGSSGDRQPTALTDCRVVEFHGLYVAAMAIRTFAVVVDQPCPIDSRHKSTGENHRPAGAIKRDDMLRFNLGGLGWADVFKF